MNAESSKVPTAPRALVLAAFATVYIVWGSTYLAIRVAVETLPPFVMAAWRFVIAGAALYFFLRLRGEPRPSRLHCRNAAVSGFMLLVAGNGLVVWAEQTVPSGLTALMVSIVPVWFVLIDWLRPSGSRPHIRTVAGVIVGFAGMILLVTGREPNTGSAQLHVAGLIALLIAGISWAGGSLYSKHHSSSESPLMTAALQMFFGGVVLIVIALVSGEFSTLARTRVSAHSIAALVYLIVFGSWVGFSAYVYILKMSKPAHVATYAYVNPVIALLLGNVLLREPLTGRVLVAAAIILAGVIIITLPKEMLSDYLPKGTARWLVGEPD